MPDKFQKIYDILSDYAMKIMKIFDNFSDKLYEKTGKKINVGIIVGGAVLLIFVIIFVKAILGFIMTTLSTGDF